MYNGSFLRCERDESSSSAVPEVVVVVVFVVWVSVLLDEAVRDGLGWRGGRGRSRGFRQDMVWMGMCESKLSRVEWN